MIKAIAFDFGGVLVDTYEYHYQTYFRKYKDLTREMHKQLFDGNVLELRDKLVVKDETLDISVILRDYLMQQRVTDENISLIEKLKKQYMIFMITSRKDSFLKEFLLKQDLLKLFDDTFGAEVHKKKDFKFNLLLDKYHLRKDEVVFVTDTLGDILQANSFGIRSIAVDYGFHERERLEKGNPHCIISKLEDIVSVLDGI